MKKLILTVLIALSAVFAFGQCSPTPYGDYLITGTKYRIVTVDSLEYAVVLDLAGHSDFTDVIWSNAQIAVLHTDSATITSTIVNGSWVQGSTFSASTVSGVCSQNSTPKYALTLFQETTSNGFGLGNCTSGCVDTMFYIHVSTYVGTGEIRLHNGTTVANASGTLDECLWNAGVTNSGSLDPDNNAGSKPTCGHYIYGGTNAEPLPVTLIDLDAQWVNDNAVVSWSTASELNNQGFAVERSFDGYDWTTLDFVQTKADGGNSVVRLDYHFLDQGIRNATVDVVYYRLKQLDLNNTSSTTEPVALLLNTLSAPDIHVFPNPSNRSSALHVKLNTVPKNQLRFELVDQLGKVYYSYDGKVAAEKDEFIIDTNLAAGIYYLEVILDDKVYSLPVLIDN